MRLFSSVWLLAATIVEAIPTADYAKSLDSRALSKYVFCHFMIGITSDRTSAAAYDDDMKRAKSLGIDAFALNIGVDPYTNQQLQFAYDSAANNGMKVFISFDFNWYHTNQASEVASMIRTYGSKPAQLLVDNKVFVSSFAGDGLDVDAVRSQSGMSLFVAPNFHPGQGDFSKVDGALNWMAWPNNGNNKAPTPGHNVTVAQGDQAYIQALAGKDYIAPVSPWFSTHFGPEVPYSKNWVFPGDFLWWDRWLEILKLSPRFLEIITWNDYGESHYIGPLSSLHTDDGASKWVNDMPHNGWLDMAKPFIAAFKAGASSVNSYITSDQVIYWYRPTMTALNCDSTDTTMVQADNSSGNYFMGRPDGYQSMADSVFVVTMLTSAGTLTVTSGGNTKTFSAPAGAAAFNVPMGLGAQQFSLSRNGATVVSGRSLKDIVSVCICGLYNFNAYVGTLPAGFSDPLGPDGLASLTQGLHVSTCQPKPSLGTAPPPVSTVTSTGPTTTPAPPTTTTKTSTSVVTPPITTTKVTSSTTKIVTSTTQTASCNTITASSQIFPTNCIRGCDVWAGPPGQDKPAHCDGT